MAFIPEDKVREIRDRVDIVSVIGEFVTLRRAGTSFVGLCPFHQEKTPSFHVNPQKQFFYCFGCQKSGDVVRFLMDTQSRTFVDVMAELAKRAGVDIEPLMQSDSQRKESEKHSSERARLLRLHEMAASFFQEHLQQNPAAWTYVSTTRKLSQNTISQFRLGYAPEKWDAFLQYAERKKVPMELLLQSGLVVKRESQRPYDRFRNRIMFPLMNNLGEIIGFGGRALPSEKPPSEQTSAKYMNSPESSLYKKGEQLYGLSIARESIQKTKQVILVEGNFDVLTLHDKGVTQTVAPMGTALTKTQVQLLQRVVGNEGSVILMLDGDVAGQRATVKDIFLVTEQNLEDLALLTEHQMDIRVVQLPQGYDPDTYIQKDSSDFMRRIAKAKPALDYLLEQALQQGMADGMVGKARVVSQLLPILRAIQNPTLLEISVSTMARYLGLDSAAIVRQVRSTPVKGKDSALRLFPSREGTTHRPTKSYVLKSPTFPPIVRNLLSLCGDHPYIIESIKEDMLDRLGHPVVAEMLREAREQWLQGRRWTASEFIDLCPDELKNAVASAVFAGIFTKVGDPHRALQDIGDTLLKRQVQQEMKELSKRLKAASQEGDLARVEELSLRMQVLVRDHANNMHETKTKM